ncbi:MAG: hypothetical protein V3573_10535 [Desulfovibrionaceae bacterium]
MEGISSLGGTQTTLQSASMSPEKAFSLGRELTEEEKKRVEQLQEMLQGLVAQTGDGNDEARRSRIRQIENEISKITGEKPQHSLAAATKKLPLKKKDDEGEDNPLIQDNKIVFEERIRAASLPTSSEPAGPGTLAYPLQHAVSAYLTVAQQGSTAIGASLNGKA